MVHPAGMPRNQLISSCLTTLTAAGSTSLSRLAWYQTQLTAANVPVEDAVSTIRLQLGLPPPSAS